MVGEDVIPDIDLDGWRGLYSGCSFTISGLLKLEGTATLNAWASALVIAEAAGKRIFGSLAILRKITPESSEEMFGLMSAGGVGISWTCCIIIASGFSPRKGVIPVITSYRMIPNE